MIKVGVLGASGYTGYEVVKILERHPNAQLSFVTSESNAGETLDRIHAGAPPLNLIPMDEASFEGVDVVFLCLPHGVSAPTAVSALKAGARVIDLSADFRLRNVQTYRRWYETEHPAPQLLEEAVYGLTEFVRDELLSARLVANPGCYPTGILLALRPLLETNAVHGTIIADSKSGVSGAGRTPKQSTHFVEVADNFSPYKIGRAHRHLPEIEQGMRQWNVSPPQLIFSPHLLPVPRGILSTIYVPLSGDWSDASLRNLYGDCYAHEPFVQVLPAGTLATLSHANRTNRCVMALTVTESTLIVTAAIDNLLKGAAGQAVQNMNVMFGIEETQGLM